MSSLAGQVAAKLFRFAQFCTSSFTGFVKAPRCHGSNACPTRSVFDRYDITSEEDLAEATRKLQMLAGTIAGTIAPPTVTLAPKRGKSLNVLSGPPGDRTRDTLIKSQVLYH